MCACVVLAVGMVAAVNLAVPMLAASALHPSAAALVWIVDIYVIFFACLVIPAGAAGDRFGLKGVLLAGLTVFAAGGLMSSMAPNVPLLLASRAITGAGAAAVMPNTLAVLLHAGPAALVLAVLAARIAPVSAPRPARRGAAHRRVGRAAARHRRRPGGGLGQRGRRGRGHRAAGDW
jgi:MFS family permease